MRRVAAIFDVDQTLVQGYTERLFFRFLIRHAFLSLPQALTYLGHLAVNPQARFQDKGYLAGLTVSEVLALARQCYQEEIAPRVSRRGISCVMEHRDSGHAVILLTGSLSFLLLPLQEELGADWLIATEPRPGQWQVHRQNPGPASPGGKQGSPPLGAGPGPGIGPAGLLRLCRPYRGPAPVSLHRQSGGGKSLLAPETPGPAATLADPLFLAAARLGDGAQAPA